VLHWLAAVFTEDCGGGRLGKGAGCTARTEGSLALYVRASSSRRAAIEGMFISRDVIEGNNLNAESGRCMPAAKCGHNLVMHPLVDAKEHCAPRSGPPAAFDEQ